MKSKVQVVLVLALMAFTAIGTTSCKKRRGGGGGGTPDVVDPSNADDLSQVVVIPGSNRVSGQPPAPSDNNPDQPIVSNSQSSASSTADNTLYLPFNFETRGTGAGYAGCYVQIDGASDYFDIPDGDGTQTDGLIVIPFPIPSNVGTGNFCVNYCIYDNAGLVSNILSTCVTIEEPVNCPASASGSDGLTIFTVNLGSDPGNVSVTYDTYSVEDRVDVFYDGTWIGGTGSSLSPGEFPPVSNCGDGQDGYVGESNTINFQYNGSGSGRLDVYMSGCIGGSTAWDVNVSCPQ
ncbi:MAG: hypothetical protein ACPF8V_00555 [Luteibaculum sp.]